MKPLLGSILLLGAVACLHAAAPTHRLQVTLEPRFGGTVLTFDSVTNTTAAGQMISVTRLDFLLSNIALRGADGNWLGLTNWVAYLSPREGRTGFALNNIPAGRYDRMRFNVGVPPEMNHADPAQPPPGHPLNPTVNGLHWNWQGGYVFFALEGKWRSAAGLRSAAGRVRSDSSLPAKSLPLTDPRSASGIAAYSWHIATDAHLMTVELPLEPNLTASSELVLALDVDRVLASPHTITLGDTTVSTHSREGDELADQLHQNIRRAFRVARVDTLSPSEEARIGAGELSATHSQLIGAKPLVASKATPYALTISPFFPQPALPPDNPLTEEGVRLGALLFFDPRLSRNAAQSCASCHQPGAAFAAPGKRFSVGADGQPGTRNAMPLFNLAWKSAFFWDGRAPSLRDQVLQPIQNPMEMHESLENVVAKVKSSWVNIRHQARVRAVLTTPTPEAPAGMAAMDYPSLFARAFGHRDVTADGIARALEQFLLTRVSFRSKFDRFAAGQVELTAEEQRGLDLFQTEYDPRRGQFGADCFHCHGGPFFQSLAFANNGLDAEPRDLGRFVVTGRPGDKDKFAVPSLRNVSVTAPYMHDGRFATLEEVVEHYSAGIKRNATLDPNLAKHPDGGVPLSAQDKRALVAFLKTLTDERLVRATNSQPSASP